MPFVHPHRPTALGALAIVAAALALLVPAAAGAQTSARATEATPSNTESANWAGYAVHRSGVSFRMIGASWRVPSASCNSGEPTYSATWIGIGGYRLDSRALEQIGTETDCTGRGRVSTRAWFELVPAPSRPARLQVHAGDLVQGTVTVSGRRVTVTLLDRTTGRRFTHTQRASVLDVSSAEWIEEAPSECTEQSRCQILPLADFGTVGFTGARAVDRSGQRGTIIDRAWSATKISMARPGRYYVSQGMSTAAAPSALTDSGSAFQVAYEQGSASQPAPARANVRLAGPTAEARGAGAPSGRLQPGGPRR